MRDEGHRYDPELARICYGLTLSLVCRRLGEGDIRPQDGGATESRH
jgi:hypothetical protein